MTSYPRILLTPVWKKLKAKMAPYSKYPLCWTWHVSAALRSFFTQKCQRNRTRNSLCLTSVTFLSVNYYCQKIIVPISLIMLNNHSQSDIQTRIDSVAQIHLGGASNSFRLLTGMMMWEREMALTLCKCCSAIKKTSLNYETLFPA